MSDEGEAVTEQDPTDPLDDGKLSEESQHIFSFIKAH